MCERAASANSESGDELLNAHVVLPHVALPARENTVVPVMGSTFGHRSDVFDRGPVGVVLRAPDSLEVHGDTAVAALVAEELSQLCVADDLGARGSFDARPALVVVVGREGNSLGSVPPVPIHVVETDLFVVAEKCCPVTFKLPVVVGLVPGCNLCPAAVFTLAAPSEAGVLVAVELGQGFAGCTDRAFAGAIVEVENFAAGWSFMAREWVAIFTVTAIVCVAVTLCQASEVTSEDGALFSAFLGTKVGVVGSADSTTVIVVCAVLVITFLPRYAHVLQFAVGV